MKKGNWLIGRVLFVIFIVAFSMAVMGGTTVAAKEKVLNVARFWEHKTMDTAQWGTYTELAFGSSVFENLLVLDKNLDISGKLAEKWTVSGDKLTYTFNLRKGVQFHHGYGEMKASDVVFSVKRITDPEVKAHAALSKRLKIKNIVDVVAVDDYTVKFTLKEPDLVFLHKLADWYVYVISEKAVKEKGLSDYRINPVGTGPFYFDKGTAGERTEIVRHEKYWGKKAKLDRVIFTIITEASTLHNSFETGEIDLFPVTDTDKTIQYKKAPNTYVHTIPNKSINYLGFGVQMKPFDDIRVRQAAALAVNRKEMAEFLFKGLQTTPDYIITPLVKHGARGVYKHEYNPEKAKKLLAEAGYPNGFDTDMYCPNDAYSKGPSTVLQSFLSQVGIRAKLNAVDFGVYLGKVRSGTAPIWQLYNGPSSLIDPYIERWTSEYAPGNNWCGMKDPEYDAIVAKAMAAPDDETKGKYFLEAQKKLVELLPFVPVTQGGINIAINKKVKGFMHRPDLKFSFESVYIEE